MLDIYLAAIWQRAILALVGHLSYVLRFISIWLMTHLLFGVTGTFAFRFINRMAVITTQTRQMPVATR